MDTKEQVDKRKAGLPLIIDRVFSTILLVAQPFVAVAQYLLVALGASEWMDGTRSISQGAATTASVLIFLIPLAAAVVTIVMLSKRRIAFWIPLVAMVLTSMMVVVLDAYGQKPDRS